LPADDADRRRRRRGHPARIARPARLDRRRKMKVTNYLRVAAALAAAGALAYYSRTAAEARTYEGQPMSPATARSLLLIKLGVSAPAPSDAAKRSELATLTTELEAMYGEGKYCPPKENGKLKTVLKFTPAQNGCMNLDDLGEIIATSRNYAELTEAWAGWHTISRPMRAKYQRFVELANEGARELGFNDVGEMWRARYDMPPAAFEKEAARLYSQVKPLYQNLHCYARKRLQEKYGKDKVPDH